MSRVFFHPALCRGYEALNSMQRHTLSEYLTAVVRQRGFPLNVANLWNALYFNYDLDAHGYFGDGINIDRIPIRQMGERSRALPVGGFIRVKTPTRAGELWTEVVYKEGCHPDLGLDGIPDWVPAHISGAPAKAEDLNGEQVSIVRETLVLDPQAFGPDWNDLTTVQYMRLLRKGRWLDHRGHLVMEAVYTPAQAELDDVTFYAHYLFEEHREGLLASCLEDHATDEDVWAALLTSLWAVRDLAKSCPELESWRGYFFDAEAYRALKTDRGAETRFGADELIRLFNHLGKPGTQAPVAYTAIGPLILDLLGPHGSNGADGDLLQGPRYVAAVCYANAYVRDRLTDEASGGLLPNGCHLRLDDAWQAGGIWRVEAMQGRRSSWLAIPPTIALGLGYASSQPAEPVADEPLPQIVSSSVKGWRVALTARDLATGEFRLSPSAAGALQVSGEIMLRLSHGDPPTQSQSVCYDPEHRLISGIGWPFDVYPGIIVYGQIESGGTVVKARTVRLAHPVVIDGSRLPYEFDEAVYCGMHGRQRISPTTLKAATTLTDLIHAVFRSRGQPTGDGGRKLALVEVITAILGPVYPPEESSPIIHALPGLNLEYVDGYYIWRPRITRRTRVLDRSLLAAYGEVEQHRVRAIVRRHWVPMHLRRGQPSKDKVADYARARIEARMHGVLPAELPRNCTWVRAHSRGGHDDMDGHFDEWE